LTIKVFTIIVNLFFIGILVYSKFKFCIEIFWSISCYYLSLFSSFNLNVFISFFDLNNFLHLSLNFIELIIALLLQEEWIFLTCFVVGFSLIVGLLFAIIKLTIYAKRIFISIWLRMQNAILFKFDSFYWWDINYKFIAIT